MADNDHDTLIEIKTLLTGVISDLRDFRKHNYAEMVAMSAKIDALDKSKASIVSVADQDLRIERVERFQNIAFGVVLVAQFVAPFIIKYLFHV